MSVSQADYEGFAALLRAMVDSASGDRISRHLVAMDVHDLWLYVRRNPDALRVVPA